MGKRFLSNNSKWRRESRWRISVVPLPEIQRFIFHSLNGFVFRKYQYLIYKKYFGDKNPKWGPIQMDTFSFKNRLERHQSGYFNSFKKNLHAKCINIGRKNIIAI
jgi:hypothetical protein